MELETQRRRKFRLPWLAEHRRRLNPGHAHQPPPENRNRKWLLRPSDSVFRHRIHGGTLGLARKVAEEHHAATLRRRPHDVRPRRGSSQAQKQRRQFHRSRVQALVGSDDSTELQRVYSFCSSPTKCRWRQTTALNGAGYKGTSLVKLVSLKPHATKCSFHCARL